MQRPDQSKPSHCDRSFHAETPEKVLAALDVNNDSGLSAVEVTDRANRFGANRISRGREVSHVSLIVNQFRSPVVWLLAIAAAVAVLFGHFQEAIAIGVVLAINGTIGFVTELKAIRSMEAIRRLGTSTSRVRRDGVELLVSSEQLVPGDIVLLSAGDVVAADMRILQASGLQLNESTLTGESNVVDKSATAVDAGTIMADQTSMLFHGTAVTRGESEAVVVATGDKTALGQISEFVSQAETAPTPMELQLKSLSGQLIWLTIALAVLIATVGMLAGRETFLMIESAIALAVAAIPEGLPIVATMALARGMWRMAEQNALIERLAAVETLGSTTTIFTDKTGTLTENVMTVAEVWLPRQRYVDLDHGDGKISRCAKTDSELRDFLMLGILCNRASVSDVDGSQDNTGDPIEIALVRAGSEAGLTRSALLEEFPEIQSYPFDSDAKIMGTVHQAPDGFLYAVKGAPEAVVGRSIIPMPPFGEGGITGQAWLSRAKDMASSGLRVLAIAEKKSPGRAGGIDAGLVVSGLVGFRDPARDDVRDAILACREAGIDVVMVTGDHAVTAAHIAEAVGIAGAGEPAIDGYQLGSANGHSLGLRDRLLRTRVFARVSPEQKLRLIALYRDAGAIVAMTGDGVNDAPALRQADIGIAMGRRGTQVAREAADVVLLDDAFPTIVKAIREGRVIFDNIRRFLVYLLSCNLSEVLVVGLAILFGLPLALLPLQILFLNLVTDVFPAFALATSEGSDDVLTRKPRDPSERIVETEQWITIVKFGLTITAVTMLSLIIAIRGLGLQADEAVTISFLTLAFGQLFHVFNMRSAGSTLANSQVTRNPWIWAALVLCALLLLAAVYVPPIANILRVVPPDASGWFVVGVLSLVPVAIGTVLSLLSRE